ncbi:mandelate racemase/muconate lactonizing protein [Advenella kashmirensis WT001]|uniref:Mandelate racemase/muconate lactonizing protein n=1 Tax=Advenella kashmirensis (strain DSM 17095 / LMG 22695 / WT001) TaxID=1036672 RepID=I3U6Z4_ADVKW|nr:mandelate racemase/muconate lactonizing enzyme family protein [Advenella kashmirensis]AFK60782.1 mandelate racemase/muconate lactonizing protein [Advenella kashmirensis WT001]
MKISSIQAHPISFPVPEDKSVRLGIGRSVKRDAVLLRVQTDEGLTGWGEAHHGRCPGAIARLIDTTLAELVVGMDPMDVSGVWSKVHKMQISSHGMGAAAALALSGLDLALWDIRCQVAGLPLHTLIGGKQKPIKAYAGGISLGWQAPEALADEAAGYVSQGYRALKLRVGDNIERDIARVTAVRKGVGDQIDILVDANTNYTLDDVRRVMPFYDDLKVGWLEEPFPAHDLGLYRRASQLGRTPLAAGENHYTRYEFEPILEAQVLGFVQPDLSKAGGITESLKIAAMASSHRLSVNPHTSATAINMATSISYMCAIDNPGYFEADLTAYNPFRDQLTDKPPYVLDAEGCVTAGDGVGIGLVIDEKFVAAHPLIDGPCYV